ncbi:MAG: DUF4190 domain-containing protein [Nocardioides sp.]
MIPGFVGAVGSAFLEAAGLALVPATVVRRAGAMALAVLTALAWTGLSYEWSYDALNVATIALVTLQFVAWLVATRRRGLPYVLIVAVLVLAFLLNVVFGAVGVYGLVVQGALWAVLGLVAAWMPVPAQRAETAGGPVRAGGAPSAGSETSTLAVAAFVVSFFVALAGIVLGHMALGEIRRTGKRGHGLAVTALVIGYGAIALILIAVLAFLAGTGSGS